MSTCLHIYHTVLKQICQWLPQERKTRQRNLAWLLAGLYQSGSVHLAHIARELALPGKEVSLVNRLRRFLNNARVDVSAYYRPVVETLLAPYQGQTVRLIIDCTKVGFKHRLLTVSLAYRKRALPLAWRVYAGAKGHVAASEVIGLLREVRALLPADCTVQVLGDAGFQAVSLLRWLGQQNWSFVIRVKGDTHFQSAGSQTWQPLAAVPLEPGQTRTLGWVRLTQQHNYGWLWLVLHWAPGEDTPWLLVSDQPQTRFVLRSYAIRMWTEEMYGDLKGHGFDLEATHLRHADRLSRLVLAVGLVYVWLLCLGGWLVKRGWRHLIDRKDRRDKSYFRLGFDWLKHCFRSKQSIRLHFRPYP